MAENKNETRFTGLSKQVTIEVSKIRLLVEIDVHESEFSKNSTRLAKSLDFHLLIDGKE